MQTPNGTRRQACVRSLHFVFLLSDEPARLLLSYQSVPSTTCEDWSTDRVAFGVSLRCEISSAKRI
jgi:hypothetical protein